MDEKEEIKKVSDKLNLKEGIIVLAREELERHLFDIATKHAKKAEENINRDDTEEMQKEMKHSIIAIVMSVFSLEALINYIGRKHYTDNKLRIKWTDRIEKRCSLIGKFTMVARKIHRDQTGDTSGTTLKKPILDKLQSLIDLRDSIVHYKPKPKDITNLKTTSQNTKVTPELQTYNSDTAKEAIKTVKEVIDSFNQFINLHYGEWVNETIQKYAIDIK
jgi:HEPN domain-containing protein